MKSRYDVTIQSDEKNPSGLFYPDACQFPIASFKNLYGNKSYTINQKDIDRFDQTVSIEYNSAQYDDIVLLINDIEDIHVLVPGDTVNYPDIEDIQQWFIKNRIKA